MHIQLIPYDSFCFVRARESPVLPRLSIYLYFIPTKPPAFSNSFSRFIEPDKYAFKTLSLPLI